MCKCQTSRSLTIALTDRICQTIKWQFLEANSNSKEDWRWKLCGEEDGSEFSSGPLCAVSESSADQWCGSADWRFSGRTNQVNERIEQQVKRRPQSQFSIRSGRVKNGKTQLLDSHLPTITHRRNSSLKRRPHLWSPLQWIGQCESRKSSNSIIFFNLTEETEERDISRFSKSERPSKRMSM